WPPDALIIHAAFPAGKPRPAPWVSLKRTDGRRVSLHASRMTAVHLRTTVQQRWGWAGPTGPKATPKALRRVGRMVRRSPQAERRKAHRQTGPLRRISG